MIQLAQQLPQSAQGQRLILDTEQYRLPGEDANSDSFFASPVFFAGAGFVLLVVVGVAVWQLFKTSQ